MKIHPLISLLSFMVFAAFVSLGQTASSFMGFLLLILVWAATKQLPAPKVWVMVRRLRIFFISLLIMYLWFTPGQLIWPLLDSWSPTYEGAGQGMQRIGALILLVFGVESLLRLLKREDLLTGLYFLATPFQRLGVDRERFIVRVLLTLEAAETQSPPLSRQKQHAALKPAFSLKHFNQYLSSISHRLAESFNTAASNSTDIDEIVFEIKPRPHWIQWLIPLMIAALFIFFNKVS